MQQKVNIIISPSQQAYNKCAMGDSEQDHTYLIAENVARSLAEYNANVLLVPKLTGNEAEKLTQVVQISNNFVQMFPGLPSFHLDIHTDAGYNGQGASGFYMSEAGKSFILKIFREVSNLTPWSDSSIFYRDLYVLRNTIAFAGLIEISFHDNVEQAKWIHKNIDSIARAICKGIIQETGITLQKTQHWAEDSYQKLINKGYKIDERRFDDNITRGEVFSLLAQKIPK
jgi:N-acetylmuramoyl-L-alanine amidase